MVSTYKRVLGDTIKPRSKPKCTKRWPNHEVVPVDDNKVPPYPPPDVSIQSTDIEQIGHVEDESKIAIRDCHLPH